jgi:allantoinase
MFLPDLVIRSRRVATARGLRPAAVHVRSGRVIGVLEFDNVPSGCPLEDAGGSALIPGVVDTHVHVQGTGWNAEEAFEATTRAAAAGGVTTIIDMPLHRTLATTSVSALEARRRAAGGRCFVDIGFWGGAVPGNGRDLAPLFEAGVFGFKCVLAPTGVDALASVAENDLRVVMPALTRIGATMLAHAELPGPIEAALALQRAGRRWVERVPLLARTPRRYATYLQTRPKDAENDAVALLVRLCHEYGTRIHLLHLSSSDALTPLYHARAARVPITAETCPHYLYFVAEDVPDGATAFKCAPPIRERTNREFLWAAVANRLIQMVVSAHSPAPMGIKGRRSGDFATAWSGIPSLQLALSVVWSGARRRGYSLDQVVDWMCRAPADLAGFARKGRIDVGYDADLIVFNPETEFVVDGTLLYDGHTFTPYQGERLQGLVERTYLRGRQVYARGATWSQPHGNLLMRSAS